MKSILLMSVGVLALSACAPKSQIPVGLVCNREAVQWDKYGTQEDPCEETWTYPVVKIPEIYKPRHRPPVNPDPDPEDPPVNPDPDPEDPPVNPDPDPEDPPVNPDKPKCNNGHGNGDQCSPGNSGDHNNAENSENSGEGNSGNGSGGNNTGIYNPD